MEEEITSTLLIQQAVEEGKLSKRQAKALRRVVQKASQPAIEQMLGLMGHIELAKALKDIK